MPTKAPAVLAPFRPRALSSRSSEVVLCAVFAPRFMETFRVRVCSNLNFSCFVVTSASITCLRGEELQVLNSFYHAWKMMGTKGHQFGTDKTPCHGGFVTCKIVFGTIPDSSRSYDLQNGAPSSPPALVLILLPRMPRKSSRGRSIRSFRNLLKTQEARDTTPRNFSDPKSCRTARFAMALPWR